MQETSDKTPSRAYFRDFLFLVMLALLALYYLALWSYNPLDAAFNSAQFPPIPIKNLIGSWGASFSASTLYFFGFGAYLLPVPFFLTGLAYFKKKLSLQSGAVFFISSILLYISLIYIFSKFLPNLSFHGYNFSSVGSVGMGIESISYSKLGRAGAPILALMLAFCALIPAKKHNFAFAKLSSLRSLLNRK